MSVSKEYMRKYNRNRILRSIAEGKCRSCGKESPTHTCRACVEAQKRRMDYNIDHRGIRKAERMMELLEKIRRLA